jgi:hypothetical protein
MAISYIGRTDLPRGIRNNNPGNIKVGDAWQGKTGQDGPFITFQDIDWGLRALARDLTNKINEGYNTITGLITRYAPPVNEAGAFENDTSAYIAAVASNTGIDPGEILGTDADTIGSLMRAITTHENGDVAVSLIPDTDIQNGISMAGNPGTIIQATGIAVQSAVQQVPGGSGTVLLLLAGVVGYYYFFRKK